MTCEFLNGNVTRLCIVKCGINGIIKNLCVVLHGYNKDKIFSQINASRAFVSAAKTRFNDFDRENKAVGIDRHRAAKAGIAEIKADVFPR